MFTSINEYKQSLNESTNPNFVRLKDSILEFFNEYPDATFDVRLFEDLEQYGITVEYIHMGEQELNDYLEQFGIFIASYDDESIEFQKSGVDEAVNPADYINRDQAIETANALGFGFTLENRRHSHYIYTEEINSPIISSIEYVLYKVANTTWKISSRITYTQINAETVSRMNTVADICWFEVI